MKAMLFAAGLGTRLKPLTEKIPKALAVVDGLTLLERAISLLLLQGVNYIVINIHHHAEQIVEFVKKHDSFGVEIHFSDERAELLETGGGLLLASSHFVGMESFIVMNADVITNCNLKKMFDQHQKSNALVTLAVRNRPESSRQLVFDKNGYLCGRVDKKKGEKRLLANKFKLRELAFSGVHIVNPAWFDLNPFSGKFSIIDSYLELCADHKIIAHLHDEDYWFDAGSMEKLQEAELFLKRIKDQS
jgi:NDP-sugar pyrophosphorylase family protein